MRLTRLLLERYGHLSDIDLVFDPNKKLHIVLGANEAGKSTALSAIADALFGIPHRTTFAFLHRQQDLRLGIGVRAADNREHFFRRRKGNKDTLRDADDAVLPENAIAAFLSGASRERFTRIFGMDGAELRRGGAEILDGKGEIGETIVQAHAGPHNLRGALGQLNDKALLLYGDKRGGRAFHIAAEAFRTARQEVETRSVRPAEYEQAAQDRADILSARARNALDSEQLESERARLDRIRRTTPARLAFGHAQQARAALGDIPSLPADAQARRSHAVQSATLLSLEIARAQAAQDTDEALLRTISVDEAVLAAADGIDALAADLNRIEGAVRDRDTQRQQAEQAARRVEEQGLFLGLPLDAEALTARLPGGFLRAEADRAIREHTRLSARRQELIIGWEQAEAAATAARSLFASLAAPEPIETLIGAIEAAKGEGRIDSDYAQAEDDCSAAQAALARALAALPFWQGSADALAGARMPLAADFAAREAALEAARSACFDRARENDRLDAALQAVQADLAGLLATGTPPTALSVLGARARRDRAWQLIRATHIEHGAAAPGTQTADLPTDLVGAFAGLMTEADNLADRRTEEAERVATYEQLRASLARLRVLREAETAALEKAQALLQEQQSAWQALWHGAGFTPGDPAQMREFLTRRQAVLALLDDAATKERYRQSARARRDAVWQGLAASMPAAAGSGPQNRVAPLLEAASLRRKKIEAAHLFYAEAKRALADKETALASQAHKHQSLEAAFAEWQGFWAPIAAALCLADGAGAEAGAQALAIWTEIDRHARDMRAARQRIAEMTAEIEIFAARVADIASTCAPGSASDAAFTRLRSLAARLAQSRIAAAERTKLRQNISDRSAQLATLAAAIAKARDELAALRALAGVEDDDALAEVIARAGQASALDRTIEERLRELQSGGDGRTLEELAQEAAGENGALLPARIADIVGRKNDIAMENEGFASRLRDLETRIATMERGHDAAEAAQRMRYAAAEAEEIAARYVRLRLSHALLRAGIERFRRERQAPLLAAAGQFFAALTEGRYEALAIEDAEDGRLVVVALRPDGTACPAERLSEGARDQLYLALRLAAIAGHAAQAELLPFIADDLLASFDDRRAQAGLRVLADFGAVTQTILFTHHDHIVSMADPATTQVLKLPVS